MAAENASRLGGAPTLDALLPYLMNRVTSRLNQNLSERLRPRKLTFQHWRVLAVLYRRDGLTLGALAEATVVPQSTLSRLVDRMVRDGLLARRAARQRDSRFVEVWLTQEGRRAYEAIVPLALAEHEAALRGFSAAETASVEAALRKMLANLGVAP
jgi:MarR family transcriptional regulator, organic hydroperoxide resistance regulator